MPSFPVSESLLHGCTFFLIFDENLRWIGAARDVLTVATDEGTVFALAAFVVIEFACSQMKVRVLFAGKRLLVVTGKGVLASGAALATSGRRLSHDCFFAYISDVFASSLVLENKRCIFIELLAVEEAENGEAEDDGEEGESEDEELVLALGLWLLFLHEFELYLN